MRISKTTSRVLREDLHQPGEQEERLESGWWRGSCLPCWLSSSQAVKHSDSRPSSQALKLTISSSESSACHAGSAHTGRQVRPPILSLSLPPSTFFPPFPSSLPPLSSSSSFPLSSSFTPSFSFSPSQTFSSLFLLPFYSSLPTARGDI